ncbi:alpha/beta hydrolase [Actinoallomurus bryophytorum]|uniref:Pimeloyl-ACP methyl ester carboxylesterase n=1 Tax=Actinoallomurus bryophytorum TaxID=1490222 RepID=A0A543CQ64_9ACTN|nr:alpha/beta hydrolase [Actinoallomurus bryophytorum]TQL99248.1 pimeloyl-ACP methyl ester carboxylesterase [Actinoallomurus bryophytorum]
MTTDFGELASDSHGTDDDRPPLVLLHGLSYDRRQWGPALRELAVVDPGRRTVCFDLPGHGESPPRATYPLDEIAAIVHDAVDEAGLDAPVVVGHSYGGALATSYAAAYPVRGVINVDQPLWAGAFAALLRRSEPALRSPGYLRVWESLLSGMGIEELPPAARELVRTATTPRQDLLLGYWAELMTGPAGQLDDRRARELATIYARGVPYHHVAGNDLAPAYRDWLESLLPGVTVTVLPGGGHFPHLAGPAEFAKILAA